MIHLKQSTASQSVIIGPFIDDTDGKTAETGLTISNTDIRLSKNGANIVAKNSGGGTHDELGYYTITLDATDTNTVGRLQLVVQETGALPVYHEFQVLEETVYDALYGSGATGYLQPTTAGRTLDVTAGGCAGIDWANVEAPTTTVDLSNTSINLCDTVTTNTDMRGTDSAATAAELAKVPKSDSTVTWNATALASINAECDTALSDYDAPTKAELDSGLAALNDISTADVNAQVDIALSDYDGPTNTEMVAAFTEIKGATWSSSTDTLEGIRDNVGGSAPSAADIADAVWDEAISGHLTSGTTGNALNAAGSAGDPWSTSLPGAYGAGTAGNIIGNNLDASVSSKASQTSVDTVDTNVDSILAAIPANFADLAITSSTGRVTVGTNNDKTGYSITGTISTLDALDTAQDTQHSTTRSAITALNDLDAAGVRTAIGLSSANIDTQLSTIDANVDLILEDTGTTLPGTLAGLNDISVSDILTTQMTEAYAADGTAPTLAQALFMIQQELGEFSISGTTITVKRLDGSTTAATFTLDDDTNPTSKTRTT
jgi:hypothetical protein